MHWKAECVNWRSACRPLTEWIFELQLYRLKPELSAKQDMDMDSLLNMYIKVADEEEAKHAEPPEKKERKNKKRQKKVCAFCRLWVMCIVSVK